MAALRSAAEPDWPVTPELLSSWHAARDPVLYHLELVAEVGGAVVGHLGVGHDDFAFQDDRYWGGLHVHPDFQRRGIGSALHARMLQTLRARRAGEVRTMLSGGQTPGIRFLTRLGYRPTWTRLELRLKVTSSAPGPFDALLDRVTQRGLKLVEHGRSGGRPAA